MKLFDSHCHLQLPQFDSDRTEVLARMQKQEVGGVVVGTDLETSTAAVALAQMHDFLWASIGLHPNDNVKEVFDEASFVALAQNKKVVAIGECGLDYFRSGGTDDEKLAQKERFEKQIQLAIQTNKALIVHCRNAHDDMLEIVGKYASQLQNKIIIHFFTGTVQLAQKYIDLGCFLSFPGPITYTDMYDESIKITPLDKILSETDSPFAAPIPFRGKRNEPMYVEEVVKKIAGLKGVSLEKMSNQILLNSQRIFGLQ